MATTELHWLDYTLFSLSLVVPLVIGVFFFFHGGRQRTTKGGSHNEFFKKYSAFRIENYSKVIN